MNQSNLIDLAQSISHGDWVGIPNIDPDWVSRLIRGVPNIVIAPMHCIRNGLPEPVCSGVAIGCFHATQTSNRLQVAFRRHPEGSKILVPTKFRLDGVVFVEDYVIAVPSMRFSSHAVMAIRQ